MLHSYQAAVLVLSDRVKYGRSAAAYGSELILGLTWVMTSGDLTRTWEHGYISRGFQKRVRKRKIDFPLQFPPV